MRNVRMRSMDTGLGGKQKWREKEVQRTLFRIPTTAVLTVIDKESDDLKGYDCNFVDPVPDSLICLICTGAARSAQQTACCGKVFCKACLLEWQSSQLDAKCPQCRKEIESFPDLRGDRDVKSLIVHCDNKVYGCEWTGELRSFEEHQSGCNFTLVPCPNECKDDGGHIVNILLKQLRKHFAKCPRRPYKCRHCKEAGEFLERTTTHLEECPSMKVACPNATCRKRVARHSLNSHLTECPFEEVPCKYARIGCNARVPRREREVHEGDTRQHFQMVVDSMSELKAKLEDLEHTHVQSPISALEYTRSQISVFTLKNFEHHRLENSSVFSTPFYTGPEGYKLCLKVSANGDGNFKGTHLAVFAYIMRGEHDDRLSWPFSGRVNVELLNQLDDAKHHTRCIHFREENENYLNHSQRVFDSDRARTGYGFRGFCSHDALDYDVSMNRRFLKDGCLCFRVRAEANDVCSPKLWLSPTGNFIVN